MTEEKEIEKNSMYIEVENEEEILRLQQEVIKSNLPIEDVAKIVGKLQKLLELTKHNTNEKFTIDFEKNPLDWTYKPFIDSQPLYNQLYNKPITLTNTSTSDGLYSEPRDDVPMGATVSSASSLPIRNDVPF